MRPCAADGGTRRERRVLCAGRAEDVVRVTCAAGGGPVRRRETCYGARSAGDEIASERD